MAFWLDYRHYILLDPNDLGEAGMNQDQDDKTTTKHMIYTFIAFAVLGVLLIIGANIIG